MLIFNFTLRHLRRHWRLNLTVLLGLTLAGALLASLPGYATAIAARSLNQSLKNATPAGRNIQVAAAGDLSAGLYGHIQDSLGDLIKGRLEVREVTLPAAALPFTATVPLGKQLINALHLWSFDKLGANVRILDGRLPEAPDPEELENSVLPPPLEAAMGLDAATRSGWGIGDRLASPDNLFRIDIVGIVEPLEPQDDMWWGNLNPFGLSIQMPNPNDDFITLSLLMPPNTMRSLLPSHSLAWRILVDQGQISVDNAATVQSKLVNLQTVLGKNRAQVSTSLSQILGDYRTQLSRARMAVFLLTTQAFIFVLYTLAMLTSFLLERSQGELASLAGRGATAGQITRVFAMEGLLLALPAALVLGPLMALGALAVWAKVSAADVAAGIPQESRWLALIAVGVGWLALVMPIYPAARRNLLDWQRARARPARLSKVQKLYLDLFLLALGGLLYWQLNQSGSFVMHRLYDTPLADPLLLIGPSLLLIAVAMIFLRLAPHLLRLCAWILRHGRGLMLPLGLARLARDPLKPSRVVLLVSMTAGLALFSNAFDDSLNHGQQEMAHYLAGADLRISVDPANGPSSQPTNQLTALPGVLSASQVFRTIVQTAEGRGIQLFAVDPATFGRVARYPPGLTNLTISALATVLQAGPIDGALPAIFSYSALPTGKIAGDQLPLTLSGRRLTFRVQGTIKNFPTLSDAFVIVSLPELAGRVNLDSFGARLFESHEVWLTVDPSQYAALLDHPLLKGHILGDAQVELRSLQADALAQGTSGAFQLSALTLAVLSVAGFLLVHYFAARQRELEFSVLRAMGLSARQLLTLLAAEGFLVILLGLAVGTAIGYGLAQVMIPFLSRALSRSLAGVTIGQVLVDWPAAAQLYGLLIGFYTLAILLLLLTLMRVGVHRVLQIGDE
jgi:putative ABC transport system permease protein